MTAFSVVPAEPPRQTSADDPASQHSVDGSDRVERYRLPAYGPGADTLNVLRRADVKYLGRRDAGPSKRPSSATHPE